MSLNINRSILKKILLFIMAAYLVLWLSACKSDIVEITAHIYTAPRNHGCM